MKQFILANVFCFSGIMLFAQANMSKIAKPEFGNEIYYFNKDSGKLMRLEKGSARMETKSKGMGGMENGYVFDGDKSTIRIKNNKDVSFIFYAGETKKTGGVNSVADSLMRAMGMGSMPSMPNQMQPTPSTDICELYSVKCNKGKRSITLQSEGGDPQAANGIIQSAPNMMQSGVGKGGLAIGVATVGIGMGMKLLNKGKKESVKYAINIKELKKDFYEITIDKNLGKGEYAFVLAGQGGIDNTSTLFAFAIE